MENYSWSPVYSAVVKFTPTKGCFVLVPERWLKGFTVEILVFKIFYGESKEAFVSCLKGSAVSNKEDPEVQINIQFADKLGVKENDKVCLQPLLKSVPTVQKIILEPLTFNDWEILELNAEFIEKDLMNQIRVVWTGHIFPVWVNQSILSVKVGETLPNSCPVLLAEYSEVHVVPKQRLQSATGHNLDAEKRKKLDRHLQFAHLRYRTKEAPLQNMINYEGCADDHYFSNTAYSAMKTSTTARAISFFSQFFSPAIDDRVGVNGAKEDTEFLPLNFDCVLRVIPYSDSQKQSLPLVVQATTVFISANTYAALYGADETPPCFAATLQKFPLPDEKKHQKASGSNSQKFRGNNKNEKTEVESVQKVFDIVCVTVMVVNSPEDDEFNLPLSLFYSKNLVVVPKQLKKAYNLEVSSLIHLKSLQTRPAPINTLTLHPTRSLSKEAEETIHGCFQKWAFEGSRKNSTYLISSGTPVHLNRYGKKCDFFISFEENLDYSSNSPPSSLTSTSSFSLESDKNENLQNDPEFGYLNNQILERIRIRIGHEMSSSIFTERPFLLKPDGIFQDIAALRLEALGGVSKLAAKTIEDIEFWLKLRPLSHISNHSFTFNGCVLVCGPKGVGKTAFTHGLCKKLTRAPFYAFIRIIYCLPLKGKRIETVSKKWHEIVSEAIHRQPSLLLFEDLDYIASCPTSHEQEVGPEGMYFANIVQAFIHVMNRITKSESKVAVIVTAQSTHSLHPSLVNTKGRHIFQNIVEVCPPNAEQRAEILQSLVCSKPFISRKTIKCVIWSDLASKTEGYVALDLDCLVNRATHAAWVRLASSPKHSEITLTQEDFKAALEGYTPSSLRGIPLQMQDPKTWNDVGGLSEVKKVIQQIIMWPIKYKQLFRNYALKPQTNILLYGAPGTGKTLLAGVVANECKLNFISIKGPELLSKYIGASEQAIRDLFKRATTARPCILFFDEFDSIAPRRGHDSTGVTDRVVNQLLTQLDGVESLEGVHVLAATSRPELIDPALLRPGRLDKCLHCPLPDARERYEILKCLSTKLPLHDDCDFQCIASQTEHFSGADLQALLYTAHIEALHDTQHTATRRYSTSSNDSKYSEASNKLLYMATVEDGFVQPSYEDGKRIVQEVDIIKEKFYGIKQQTSRQHSMLNVLIHQDNLLKVASEMKPSVSPQERLRYEIVLKNFQRALSGESTASLTENVKRVTLA